MAKSPCEGIHPGGLAVSICFLHFFDCQGRESPSLSSQVSSPCSRGALRERRGLQISLDTKPGVPWRNWGGWGELMFSLGS